MNTFDMLGRRTRTKAISTGKRISLQPADLIWFQKLAEHGPMPSSYLLAFTRHLRRSDKRATERLTDLFNEETTKHHGRYLDRPSQQFRTIDSRYNQLVYALAPAGQRALAESGISLTSANASGPWLHRLMVACTTASIEICATAQDDLTFIPGHWILARADAELRYPVSICDDRGQRIAKHLIPDALFGLRYQTAGGDRFRFFVVECDRATEPAASANWSRKSWLRNLRQNDAYIVDGGYREHLNLTTSLLLLTITTDPKRLSKLLHLTAKEVDRSAHLLFQYWGGFGPIFRPPQPNQDLLSGLWQRAGHTAFRIDQP